jgi:hypothetical protein
VKCPPPPPPPLAAGSLVLLFLVPVESPGKRVAGGLMYPILLGVPTEDPPGPRVVPGTGGGGGWFAFTTATIPRCVTCCCCCLPCFPFRLL